MQEWYVPITILPGICLLILSTSNIMIDLSREIKVLINENDDDDVSTLIERKLKQLKLINSAMALLYLSVVSFVLSALFSGLKENTGWNFQGDIYVLLLGILVAVLALLSLMMYSFRAVKLRQDQYHKNC
jgi:uncharacterized membrane protein HdeD (DUF308 family)